MAFDAGHAAASGGHHTRTSRILLLVVIALLAGGSAVFAVEKLGLGSGSVPLMSPPQVASGPVGVGALGWVEPASRVRRLGPPSNLAVNRVDRLFVHEGEQVAAGQLLAEFADAAVKDGAVLEAGAAVTEAKAALARVTAAGRPSEIEAQQARIDSLTAQQEIASRDAARATELVPSGAGARAVAERDRAAADRAAADLREAEAQLVTLQRPRPEDVAVAEAHLRTARAALVEARADAALSRVYAPVAGRILKIYARPGDLVGTRGLLDLADLDRLDVVADVYESDLPRVRLGASAKVTVPGDPRRYVAQVVEIGRLVQHTTDAGVDPVARVDGRTVQVRLALLPDGSEALRHRINMQVQVAVQP
ncbi:MAG TPA: efflux RND transporter periplasmic adaptor subunit [Acetobacteraceae bacterium]|nr:efflux RND transporter periplasmic adaptor subunit [Acetobacteraceae bacterium]